MIDTMMKVPGVQSTIAFPGLSINDFTNAPNAGIVFATLKPFDERTDPKQTGAAIAAEINQRLGAIGGFKMMIEDRGNLGYDALNKAVQDMQARARTAPELAGVFPGFQINAPFRSQAQQIEQLKVRSDKGEMIPLSSLMRIKDTHGPDCAQRYNAYVSADLNGGPAPGCSSGQAQAALERIAKEVLPPGIAYEWTELTY